MDRGASPFALVFALAVFAGALGKRAAIHHPRPQEPSTGGFTTSGRRKEGKLFPGAGGNPSRLAKIGNRSDQVQAQQDQARIQPEALPDDLLLLHRVFQGCPWRVEALRHHPQTIVGLSDPGVAHARLQGRTRVRFRAPAGRSEKNQDEGGPEPAADQSYSGQAAAFFLF